jgi:hypothetical protein
VSGLGKLTDLLDDVSFSPTPEQRQVKARWTVKCQEDPAGDVDKVTAAQVSQTTGDSRIVKWWGQAGFRDWFLNKAEFRERVEYLLSKALDCAETILEDSDPKMASAQVQLIKALAEIGGRGASKVKEVKYLDADINRMSPLQLQTMITERLKRLQPAGGSDVIETSATETNATDSEKV